MGLHIRPLLFAGMRRLFVPRLASDIQTVEGITPSASALSERALQRKQVGQTFRHVVVPIILPSLIGVGLFGFTLSYDEFARTLMAAGTFNTLPLEIYAMTTNVTTPVLYALGTLTTAFSFLIILLALVAILMLRRRAERRLAAP